MTGQVKYKNKWIKKKNLERRLKAVMAMQTAKREKQSKLGLSLGTRIADFDILGENLICCSCKSTLSLKNVDKDARHGIDAIWSVRCSNCDVITPVHIGKQLEGPNTLKRGNSVLNANAVLDVKSKLKNHYRAHRLSFWLNLVPDLHKPGSDDVPRSHHLLDAEQVPPRFIQRLPATSARPATRRPAERTSERPSGAANLTTALPSELTYEESTSQPEDGFAAYSTALSVTIAIGCSLLILNVLIFAGVYYQRDKNSQQQQHHHQHQHQHQQQQQHQQQHQHQQHQQQQQQQQQHYSKKRQENGQMPNNVCGELEGKGAQQERRHVQLAPAPVFAEPPSQACHVPMPPPPPKNAKPSAKQHQHQQQHHQQGVQNLIISPSHLQHQVESMPMAGSSGTLKKSAMHPQHNSQQTMEELRV